MRVRGSGASRCSSHLPRRACQSCSLTLTTALWPIVMMCKVQACSVGSVPKAAKMSSSSIAAIAVVLTASTCTHQAGAERVQGWVHRLPWKAGW